MAHLSRVARRLLGDNVDGAADGRCAVEGRTAPAHHFHALNHVGRNLLQSVDALQGRKHGARIDEHLRIVPVESVDAHLRETAVLAVVFRAHSGLEVEPLGQAGGMGRFKEFCIQNIHHCRRLPAQRLVAVGRDYHLVERHLVFIHFKVHFRRLALHDGHLPALRPITCGPHLNGEPPLGQVFQQIVACGIGGRLDECAHDKHADARQVLLRFPVHDMSHDIGIGLVPARIFGPTYR